ncbi:hypothetical protein [Kitasatospora sp. MAP5-34]|uniref:hypothetical protein n=1 Tax=Kitasatospora sp. MAP5-34 TaxID=3035102 RepID=UPI0024732B67|nr:hypothetical protein [Kitasatospora sp. MAP5-34]MDH6574492.1 hypothetical protein [Kitasatospora sp. MAP5-34]
MRLRNAVVAAVSALGLVLAVPGSALAATGQFRYTFINPDGYEMVGFMNNPPSGECLNLPGRDDDLPPAFAPQNRTDALAIVYVGTDCHGARWPLHPGIGASDRLVLRSVEFA